MNQKRRIELCSILEISCTNPTEQEIKSSFFKLAKKHHPDNNPDNQEEATEKFQEISNAYEILTGKQKDNSFLNDSFGQDFYSYEDDFAEFFNSSDEDEFFEDFFDEDEFSYSEDEDEIIDNLSIKIEEITTNSFKVKWKKPDYYKKVKRYEIYMVRSKKKTDKLIYSGKDSFCFVGDLDSNKKYTFYIVGYNQDCYDEFKVKTLDTKSKPQKPQKETKKSENRKNEQSFDGKMSKDDDIFLSCLKFELNNITSTTVDLNWTIAKKDIFKQVKSLKFNIISESFDSNEVKSFWFRGKEQFCQLKFLNPNSKYKLFIQVEKENKHVVPCGFEIFETLKNEKFEKPRTKDTDKKNDDEQQVEEEEENYSNLSQAELESNKERLKNRFVTKATQRKQREQIYKEEESIQNDQEDNEEEEIEEEENPIFQSEEFKKLSIKKQQKLREKQERKEYNEQQKIIKQQKREREEQLSKEYQEKREAKQKEMEQEEKRLKEEKEKKDKAEYDEWRHLFEVEDKGEKEDDINNNEGLLKQFIEHIKTQKVVILEELSAQFSMKTQDVIDRIKSLESDGLLSGILDDRGKFIYITEDEIQGEEFQFLIWHKNQIN
eukprot:gene3006-5016_t